jgi:hypothetical protein
MPVIDPVPKAFRIRASDVVNGAEMIGQRVYADADRQVIDSPERLGLQRFQAFF